METTTLKFKCKVCTDNSCTFTVEDWGVGELATASMLRCPFEYSEVTPKWKLKGTKEVKA